MATPGRQQDRWSPLVGSPNDARLPVAWTPADAPPVRPRIGASPEELDARERRRRTRLRLGGGSAALGLVTLLAGLVLRDGTGDDTSARLREALSLQNTGRLAEATVLYQEVIADEPATTLAYFNLGVIEQAQGLDDEAAANYEQVLALDPAYTPALFNLAILRSETGDPASAMALYRRVIALDRDHAAAMMNLGILLLNRGDEVEASRLINRAIEIDPSMAGTESGTP